ncbi:hypothetical protein CDL15_Pgr000136 [Punica granatum]|uniref:Uncharacterized protein n=1 Tax=Punica granatum TaxID=22663 RepID=A0A218Y1N5_PUNGR|nr:hypothetical protein CDL15_Pgr000136 [Punica granatum]
MGGDCRCNQPEKPQKAEQLEKLLNTALRFYGYLANHMPLGSFFCYQILSNVTCFNKTLMAIFVTGCRLGCFLSCFTDMEEAGANNNNIGSVRYGFVTICCVSVNDLVHAVTSTFLFAAVALTDQNSIDAF